MAHTIYPGTLKHYLVVSVQENYLHILAHPAKNGNDCLLAAGHSTPVQSGWGLSPRNGKQGLEEAVILPQPPLPVPLKRLRAWLYVRLACHELQR
jgi:hypothetical protein